MHIRWQRFYQWWTLTRVLGALALLIGVVSLVVNLPIPSFLSDIAPELVGIGVTVLLIDSANERRAIAQEKAALILQMGSPSNDFALEAVRILRQKDWLMDGSLQGASLEGANLQRANLVSADLQWASLFNSNLQGATLNSANLTGVDLRRANLQGTYIRQVNLQNANLSEANLQNARSMLTNLQGVDLRWANLQGADLDGADLQGADLTRANLQGVTFTYTRGTRLPICDETTILPDGSRWTPDRDWREFTHPEKWVTEQNKETLISKLGKSKSLTEIIVSNFRQNGWLMDGTLNNIDLRGVDLSGQNLSEVDLKGTDLKGANLKGVNLQEAKLQGTNLQAANLQGVTFDYILVDYSPPICDENTILPDGSHWTPGRDWREFTHPEAWAAEQAKKRFTFSKPPGFARGLSSYQKLTKGD